MSALLTAVLIVRDESAFLDSCLQSLAGVVDSAVIVDTGSVDDTRDICRKHGIEPLEFPWTGDFSEARNYGLEAAGGDWLLYIDADERLILPPQGLPQAQMADPSIVALTVNFRARVNITTYNEIRLFRRMDAIRFRGRIHETIHPDIHALLATGDYRMERCSVGIDHYGYEGDQTHKHRRNLPLLEKAVLEDPNRVYLHHTLGEALMGLGREDEALAALTRAVALSGRFADQPKQIVDGFLARIMLINHWITRAPAKANELCEGALVHHADLPLLHYWKWRCLFELGADRYNADELLSAMDALIATDGASYHHDLVAFTQQCFGSMPWSLKGAVYARQKEFQLAAEAFHTAAALAPDDLELRVKAAYFGRAAENALASSKAV